MQNNLRIQPNRKTGVKIQIEAELFLLAVHSYPESFRHQPAISFEQHFLKLVAASHPSTEQRSAAAHAAGR